jgi:NAD(P)-dependent dehydrogenase (short-subunit alcohol dehydrogenase family)
MKTFLTGSTRGIGKAITELLLENNIQVTGCSKKTSFKSSTTNYTHLFCDLSDPNQVKTLKSIFDEKHPPEVLINNATIFVDADFNVSDNEWITKWDLTLQVNLRAAALLCKWAVSNWLEQGIEGRIINISSRAGMRGDTQQYASYAASKAGMIGLTKSIARSLGKQGITAYSIAPGFVETDMAIESMEVYGKEYLTQGLALNDIVPLKEIAHLVLLVAQGKLTHATGQTFHVNSGSYLI